MNGVIADHPTPEMYRSGLEIDCQCARCGSSIATEDCDFCGEDTCCCLYPDDNLVCDYCRGTGVWRICLSSAEWCQENPLPGREGVERGAVEWFTVPS